jgi:hypothetical protein
VWNSVHFNLYFRTFASWFLSPFRLHLFLLTPFFRLHFVCSVISLCHFSHFFPKKGKNFLLFWFICVVFCFLLSIVTFIVSFYLPPSLLTFDITLHSLFDLQPEHYNGTLQNKLTLHKSIKHPPTTSQMALNSNAALWNDFLYLFRGRWKTTDN